VEFTPSDPNHGHATKTIQVSVLYRFVGFLSPVKNPPVFNKVRAGRAVPLRFSLGGFQGLRVLKGTPSSTAIACRASAPSQRLDEDDDHDDGRSGLRADGFKYIYVWRTDRSWAGTCRKLAVTLADGTTHEVLFSFEKKAIHGRDRDGRRGDNDDDHGGDNDD
jgi:hypothetical protein